MKEPLADTRKGTEAAKRQRSQQAPALRLICGGYAAVVEGSAHVAEGLLSDSERVLITLERPLNLRKLLGPIDDGLQAV